MAKQKSVQNGGGTDDFDFALVTEFIKGYNSAIDPTNTTSDILVRGSQNVYRKSSGTVANRPGKKQYDAVDGTLSPVSSAFVWNTSLGATLPMRVSNSKLSVYSTITGSGVWYDLQTGLTLTRYIFDTIWDNSLKKDFVVFVRGDSNLFRWDGGIGLFVSGTVNTIVLASDAALAGFPTSGGTVTINGNTYTYSGISGSTLTGVNNNSSAEPTNSIVLLAVVTNATTPASGFNNDFCKTINNQLWVGSYTSRLVYISKNSSYIDYTQSSPRIPGDGELLTLDDSCKGITVKDGNGWLTAGSSYWYEVTFTQITVGSTLTEQTKVAPQPTPKLAAALAHEFIEIVNDTIIYLSQDQQLRTIGLYRNLNQPAYPALSVAIKKELSEEDFLGPTKTNVGELKAIGDFIYLIAPKTGKVFLHQTKTDVDTVSNVVATRLWHTPFIWGISRIDVINGTIVGFSNSNPQMYSLWNTGQWHDDSPSGQLPYTCIMLMAYQNGGRRQGKIVFDKTYWEGYASNGSEIFAGVYYDYQGSTALLSPIINSTDSLFTTQQLFTGVIPPSLGDASLGDNPLGDGLNILPDDQALLPKFREIIGVAITDCFEYALMVYSSKADSRWEILALGANHRLSQSEAVEIVK